MQSVSYCVHYGVRLEKEMKRIIIYYWLTPIIPYTSALPTN